MLNALALNAVRHIYSAPLAEREEAAVVAVHTVCSLLVKDATAKGVRIGDAERATLMAMSVTAVETAIMAVAAF